MAKKSQIGFFVETTTDPAQLLHQSFDDGFNFIISSLSSYNVDSSELFCDLFLSSTEWSHHFVGYLNTKDVDTQNFHCQEEINAQLNCAAHLGLKAIMIDLPKTQRGIAALGCILNQKINPEGGLPSLQQIWIQIDLRPLDLENSSDSEESQNGNINAHFDLLDPWMKWNQLRRLLLPCRRVGVVLHLGLNALSSQLIERWAGEPIKAIVVGSQTFLTNKQNFPVLSKHHQNLITMIRDKTAFETSLIVKQEQENENHKLYAQYLNYLCSKTNLNDATSQYARGFEDMLQLPLQPLMDNLESHTYEIFEKDPVKYEQYRKAIACAMKTIDQLQLIIMVVGAGRGPLVHATLQAAKETNKYVQIFAVEKNPNAVLTLKYLKKCKWGDENGLEHGKVQVVASDMREWESPEVANIIVSELLGSFGDNELSPECLDGVYRFANEKTISIPQSYTSFVAPIMSQKLHLETFVNLPYDKPSYYAFECTYVAYLRNFYMIDSPKPLFTFEHNDLSVLPKNRDNRRHDILNFTCKLNCCLHGFAGYFDAKLFDNIHISIVPGQESKDMFSWFPLWIPIKNPIDLKNGDEIQFAIWRRNDKHKVWYEWAVMSPTTSDIHNSNGRSQFIGL